MHFVWVAMYVCACGKGTAHLALHDLCDADAGSFAKIFVGEVMPCARHSASQRTSQRQSRLLLAPQVLALEARVRRFAQQ
jgi:hypothetical protein